MSTFEVWIMGAFAGATILSIWFNSNFPIHATKFLRRRGCFPELDAIKAWPVGIDYDHWLRHDWENWVAGYAPSWLSELLSCPTCLSCHISFWLAVCLGTAMGDLHVFLFGCLGWPAASNLILKLLKR